MPRWPRDDDAWDDQYESDDGPDDGDGTDEGDEPTVPCPYCGREIHEESPRCPYCEKYVSTADSPPHRRPWWLIVGVLLCLYVVYRWIVR